MNLYRAFVVRCWQEGLPASEQAPAWRFALVEIGGGADPRGFADYDELAAFLKRQLDEPSNRAPNSTSPFERDPNLD